MGDRHRLWRSRWGQGGRIWEERRPCWCAAGHCAHALVLELIRSAAQCGTKQYAQGKDKTGTHAASEALLPALRDWPSAGRLSQQPWPHRR